MRGSVLIATVLVVIFILSCGWLTAAPIANPSPGPCCIDGVCYPKRETWGFYGTRWRQWPDDLRPELSGRPDLLSKPELPDELPSVVLPEPKDEDLKAPPPTKTAEADTEGTVSTDGDVGPSLPLVPAVPVLPGAPSKPLVPTLPGDVGLPDAGGGLVPGKAAPGGTDSDPPPALPFNAPKDQPGDQPKLDFKLQRIQPMRRLENELDLPPPLPRGISRRGPATPADRQVASSRSVSKRQLPTVSNPRTVVVRAGTAVVPVSLTKPRTAGDRNVATTVYEFPIQSR